MSASSNGGIGRHEGLKIPWPLRLCGFKSRFEYGKSSGKPDYGVRSLLFFIGFLIYSHVGNTVIRLFRNFIRTKDI